MNWNAWRCWFRDHEYAYQEVGLDPKQPEASAAFRDFLAEQFDGRRVGVNRCKRCDRIDDGGVVLPDGKGGTISPDKYVEQRFRRSMDDVARLIEERQGGEVQINVPSLSDQPIPLRDALKLYTELEIAAEKSEALSETVPCWSCNHKIEVGANRGKRVACPACGKVQAMP